MTSSDSLEPPFTDRLLANNERYAREQFAPLPGAPSRHVAVVACMDARLDVPALLGLQNGEAHIIRNAGGVITDDVIRSLCLSQRKLGTSEVMLIHHTDCGLQTVTDDGFKDELHSELGVRPAWAVESFADPYVDTQQSMQRLRLSPFLPRKDQIRGFVYDVATGKLNEVVSNDGG